MTYGFRALMCIQFDGQQLNLTSADLGEDEIVISISGTEFLEGFEIVGIDPQEQVGILAIWLLCMHLVSVIYLLLYKHRNKRTFVYSGR
jgi:hypothetical protein